MPYIKQAKRKVVTAENAGELNYKITSEVNSYMKEKGLSYQTINDILGAIEGAKLEFYRRIAANYENKKIEQNGDVYPDVEIL